MAFKFVLGHHLKTLLNDFEDKQKKDISDFAKGHLNESRLLQAPLVLNRKSWASSQQSPSSKRHKKQSQKRQTNKTELIQPPTNIRESNKLDALLDFTLGTSGVIPPLPAKLSNNPDVRYRLTPESNREREVREKSSQSLYSQLDDGTLVEELPLQEIQVPALKSNVLKNKNPTLSSMQDVAQGTTAVDPSSHSVLEMYSRGVTKTDQYKKMKSFETVVLRKKEMTERKILSGEKATKHHERKLEKELAALKLNTQSSNFHKLQVFSSVFEDIIDETPLFNQILQSIKEKYDNYIAHILDKQVLQDDLLREQVNQMSATGMSRPGEMAAAAERLVYLEEMTRSLLKQNQRLHEEVKSQRNNLNKTPEIPAQPLKPMPAKRTPPGGYSRKEIPVELSVELENMKPMSASDMESNEEEEINVNQALILEKLDELNALHVQIRDDHVPITVCTHLEQCIKETEGEVQKLLKQNEYFERSIAEMEAELKEAIVEADTSEKDARRIWNKVNFVREMFVSQGNGNKTREEDLDEESKWNWYIS